MAMKKTTFLYIGAIGSLLALLGSLGLQSTAANVGMGSANLSTAFTSGQNLSQMADELSDALPDIRRNVDVGMPYAGVQMAGYAFFSLGFVGLWRMTDRSLGLIAFICFLILGIVTLVSYLVLPGAMEELIEFLQNAESQEAMTSIPGSLMVLGLAGVLNVIMQLGGSVAGGYELYRIGKEFDHDLFRGGGALLMAAAVAIFIPVMGTFLVILAIGVTGLCFYLLARMVDEAVEGDDSIPGQPVE